MSVANTDPRLLHLDGIVPGLVDDALAPPRPVAASKPVAVLRILEASEDLHGRIALTVGWPDGSETAELVSQRMDDWLSTRVDYAPPGSDAAPVATVDVEAVREAAALISEQLEDDCLCEWCHRARNALARLPAEKGA